MYISVSIYIIRHNALRVRRTRFQAQLADFRSSDYPNCFAILYIYIYITPPLRGKPAQR